MRKWTILILLPAALAACLYFSGYRQWFFRDKPYSYANYKKEVDSVLMYRDELASAFPWRHPEHFYAEAGRQFTRRLDERLFPYWEGTDWDFNGTSEVPGKGSIACGYFVTTLLQDMGVNLNRAELSQCASEKMIKSLVSPAHIFRYSNSTIQKFVDEIRAKGDGVYLTGLDQHTGILVCRKGRVDFLHSGGGIPARVIREEALSSSLLVRSAYRVVGKITSDKKFLAKWIRQEKFR